MQPPERVRFAAFELNVRTGELLILAEPVGGALPRRILLRDQSFQILRMLIESQGKVVSREEIRNKLWPNDTIVDFDRSINVAMAILRRALGDSAESPRYIETLARRGYRLVVPVEWQQSVIEPPEADHEPRGTPPPFAWAQSGDLIGKKVSRYRVLEVLGAGGMGMVYMAEDLKLGRRVALKFLPEETAGDPTALKRFEREARTASALNHPNICTIYGIEVHEGKPFIVMELLVGEALSHRLAEFKSRPFSLESLLNISVQICDGLQAAHSKGIIHRDIKPGNIFLTNDGRVKILDFGLAKLVDAEQGPENSAEAKPERIREAPEQQLQRKDGPNVPRGDLTFAGTALGTMGYMSPEQIRKETLDARTDIFSFGLVLYEMATGSRAFAGETTAITHQSVLHDMPAPVRDLNPSLPRRLDAVISKASEKNRAMRYQSAAEMRQDLLSVRKQMRPGSKLLRWSAAVTLILLALVSTWIYLRNRVTFSPNDTIVRAEFDNRTADTALNDGLDTALQVALEQTPYLNILSGDKVRETMSSLNLPEGTKLTAEIASRVCQLTGSRAVVASSIADEGNRFHIELRAVDCAAGRKLVSVVNDANSRNEIVRTLGLTAFELRAKLGEPESSLIAFNKPLESATSSSPDALHFLALAYKDHLANDLRAALGHYRQAIEKDPAFALAYVGEGSANWLVLGPASAKPDLQKAFDLQDRLTAPAEFQVETSYYGDGTGQWDRELRVAEGWVRAFPRDVIARINFATGLDVVGRHEDALVQGREAVRLLPSGPTYNRLFEYAIHAQRLDEAREIYAQISERKFEDSFTHFFHALLASLQGDQAAMQQEWTWAEQHPSASGEIPRLQEELLACHGHIRDARRLRAQMVDAALKRQSLDDAAFLKVNEGLLEAELGDRLQSRQAVTEALKFSKDEDIMLLAALASARAGDVTLAQNLATDLNQRFRQDFMYQSFSLPTIRAALELNRNAPMAAVGILQPVTPFDQAVVRHGFGNIYPAYLRGFAYLQMKNGRLAAQEFQKVLDHPAVVEGAIIGSLAHLQLARAQAMMGDQLAARKSYEDFLALWKDADADLPVLKEAEAEYVRTVNATEPPH